VFEDDIIKVGLSVQCCEFDNAIQFIKNIKEKIVLEEI